MRNSEILINLYKHALFFAFREQKRHIKKSI